MTARYRGTCVGGVADGHWVERDDAKIRIEKRQKARELINLDGSTAHAEETLEGTDYQFLLLLGNSATEIGVWAVQGTKVEQVIERLVRCYNPRTGLIGVPVPNALPIKKGG